MTAITMTGGQAVVESLKVNDVDTVVGLIGSSTLEILDALYDCKDIRYIGCHDERSGIIMSDAYARMKNKHGVFLAGQAGPGATNTITGLAQAKAAFSPVVSLAGAISSEHEGKDAFQEVDQQSLFTPVTKRSWKISDTKNIHSVLQEAFKVAITPRMGPVNINLPRDIMGQSADFQNPSKYQIDKLPEAKVSSLMKAVELLTKANNPVIVVGAGIKNNCSHESVLALAELINAPCCTSPGHGDALPFEHPLNAGQMGPRGNVVASRLVKEADVILVLGSRLGFNSTFYSYDNINKDASIIHCEIDENSIGRYFPVEVGIFADAKTVAEQLLTMLKSHQAKNEAQEWVKDFQAERKAYLEARDRDADVSGVPIQPSGLFKELRQVLPKNAAITMDAGTLCLQATDALNYFEPKSLFTPLDFGLVGFSFPAGLGIKLAAPERPVVSCHGDGGMGMVLAELSTAVDNNINTTTIVFNNGSWGAEKSYQKDFFNERYIGADVSSPQFDKVAELYGCKGYKVEKVSEIKDAVDASLSCGKPAVIDVAVDPNALYSFRRDSFEHKVKK